MPLLHQDNSRGSGGSKENRHSIGDFMGFDTAHFESAAAAAPHHRNGNGGENEWRWEGPGSPEAAQSPRALVPANCFPTRNPSAFTSFSESAQPGSTWSDESTSGRGITDLIASLKALALPSASCGANTVVKVEREGSWERDRAALLPRRASFSGVSTVRRRGEVLRWEGELPPRCWDPSGGYSAKVFLGGLPWDISERGLSYALRHFQPFSVEWPGGEEGPGGAGSALGRRGYAYVTFDSERRVRALLAASRRVGNNWYYRIGTQRMKTKEVQVIPWAVSDSNWVLGESVRLVPGRTVFVGALHGMLSASALAYIMNDLFSGVVYAGIDTDKNKYPIGSGRVTFNNVHSYIRAISAAYVEIHTDKFTKKIQVNPYLEDSMCSVCNLQQGPYFCRNPTCFVYYCRSCWLWQHRADGDEHVALTRNSKTAHDRHDQRNSMINGMLAITNGSTPSPATSGTSGSSDTCEAPDACPPTWN